ncbi:hypothetical protein DUI87_29133 [Hirundo rustica rustica]|uniref:Uncharacterized protein n=1 Tax=Hirundo rustica rustica TaxID=333673 RepID=A0A3M0J0F8_HIRRU|nr:hypothetical protein DUI87_29133 [Hirundo rustica rustica]
MFTSQSWEFNSEAGDDRWSQRDKEAQGDNWTESINATGHGGNGFGLKRVRGESCEMQIKADIITCHGKRGGGLEPDLLGNTKREPAPYRGDTMAPSEQNRLNPSISDPESIPGWVEALSSSGMGNQENSRELG